MANIEVKPGYFRKTMIAPSSKSYANRYLVLAALDNEDVFIKNLPPSSDVEIMLDCLGLLGLKIDREADGVWIKGSYPQCETHSSQAIVLPTGDGGTTNRFLVALVSRGKNKYQFKPTHRMSERPMDELYQVLKKLNVKVTLPSDSDVMVEIMGPPDLGQQKQIDVDCSRSTQFITALAMSYPEIEFIAQSVDSSEDYWTLTQKIQKNFQTRRQQIVEVPVDFSSLSYPLALAALDGTLTVSNCQFRDELQADSRCLQYLEEMGVELNFVSHGLVVKGKQDLNPVTVDVSLSPDIFPTMAFLASYAQGESVFSNLEVLHHKESDRIVEMLKIFDLFSVQYEYRANKEQLIVYGPTPKISIKRECTPPADHRMVMVSYLFLRVNAGGVLHNSECVNKSFANFYKLME